MRMEGRALVEEREGGREGVGGRKQASKQASKLAPLLSIYILTPSPSPTNHPP